MITEVSLDQLPPLLPGDFFHIAHDLQWVEKKGWKQVQKKPYQMENFSFLLFEDSFANVHMGWHKEGLTLVIDVEQPFLECFFPEYRKGDSVELFLDTRDGKSAGFLTRFCHHFVILPRSVEGVLAQEVTYFRSDEKHELCDGDLIETAADFQRKSYTVKIFIPSECLHGYDPEGFDRLGFAYRINRQGGDPQHFAISSTYLAIEQQPSLWATLHMRKE